MYPQIYLKRFFQIIRKMSNLIIILKQFSSLPFPLKLFADAMARSCNTSGAEKIYKINKIK